MKRVLVTGAGGFIGSMVAERLCADMPDVQVCGIDNFDDTYDRWIKEENVAACAQFTNYTFVESSIADFSQLERVFADFKPTHVLHLAAKADTRHAVKNPYVYIETNIVGTTHIFDLSVQHGVTQCVCASSSSVYGNSEVTPWSEGDYKLQPISPYGVTKLSTEHLAHTYYHNYQLPVTMLRYFNVYGERNRPGMVPYIWTEKILKGEAIEISGDGSRRRDYTYIGDVVDATILALQTNLGCDVLNIGYGQPLSLLELKDHLEVATGKTIQYTFRESHSASVEQTYANTTKAKALLGWEPKVSHTEGFKRLVAWFTDTRIEKLK